MSVINNKLKWLQLICLAAVLGACGLADTSNPLDDDNGADERAPQLLEVLIDNKKVQSSIEIPRAFKLISITFDEALDPASIDNAISFSIEIEGLQEPVLSASGTQINIARTADASPLPYNTTYEAKINKAIRDLAGNAASLPVGGDGFRFSTPKAKTLSARINNLKAGAIEFKNSANSSATSFIVKAEQLTNHVFRQIVEGEYEAGKVYRIELLSQPTDQFCAITNGSGIMGDQDVTLDINCSRVKPAFTVAPNWNDYVEMLTDEELASGSAIGVVCPDNGRKACRHAGELRKFSTTVTDIAACTELQISDKLGAFNWTCHYDVDSSKLTALSTGLKSDKKLADLIDIEALKWKKNSIVIRQGETPVDSSDDEIWWANPIHTAITYSPELDGVPGDYYFNAAMDQEGAIYLAKIVKPKAKNQIHPATDHRALSIKANKVALVVKDGLALRRVVRAENKQFLWLEGVFETNSQSRYYNFGHQLVDVHNSTLRNFTSKSQNQRGFGLALSNARYNVIKNTRVSGSDDAGIAVENAYFSFDVISGNEFINVTTSGNKGHGLLLSGKGDTLRDIRSSNNGGDGYNIQGRSLNIDKLNSNNNLGHGILFGSDVRDTVLNTSVSAANNGNGIEMRGRYSVLNGLTVTHNAGDGLHLAEKANNNTLIGVLSTFNGAPDANAYGFAFESETATNTQFLYSHSAGDSMACLDNNLGETSLCDLLTTSETADGIYYPGVMGDNPLLKVTVGDAPGHCTAVSGENICSEFGLTLHDNELNPALNVRWAENLSHLFKVRTVNSNTFLANAVELLDDNQGDDDGLCEADEPCVDALNIGADQSAGYSDL